MPLPRPAYGVLAAGLAVCLAGALLTQGGPARQVGVIPRPRPPAQPGPALVAQARPVGLRLPGEAGPSSVVPVTVDAGGALAVPEDPATLGWWSGGAMPGAGRGSIVIDGHIDSSRYGAGVFAQLRDLHVGDSIEVATAGESRTYAVTGRRQFDKTALPAEVFDQTVGERLVLITCGGTFNRQSRHYSQNTVVYAVPSPQSS